MKSVTFLWSLFTVGLLMATGFSHQARAAHETEIVGGITWTYTIFEQQGERYAQCEYANPLDGDVIIPDQLGGCPVEVIRMYAFSGSTNLLSINFPPTVRYIGEHAFYSCESLSSNIVIPNNVATIAESAFQDCGKIPSVELPDGLTKIGSHAFSFCSSLESLTIPDNVTDIGENAFYMCGSLSSPIDLPSGMKNISTCLFAGCSNMPAVVIPDGVTNIAPRAFQRCRSITNVAIPNTVKNIGSGAFEECDGLLSVTLGSGVTNIGACAFCGCSGLSKVSIPEGVTSIKQQVFMRCSNLSSVEIPDGIKQIELEAFSNCSNLETIALPNSITNIQSYAFECCSNLMSVTIPNNTITLGSGVFSRCSKLSEVWFDGKPPLVASGSPFSGVANGAQGYYLAKYREEWLSVIDSNGKWQGLIMSQIPAPVLELKSANPTVGSLTLEWTDSLASPEVTYSVYRGTGEDRSTAVLLDGNVTGRSWTDKTFRLAGPDLLSPVNYWVVANGENPVARESNRLVTRHRYGVFVGLSDYAPNRMEKRVPAPAKEAAELQNLFVEHGGMDEPNALVLTNSMADWETVKSALETKAKQAIPGDLFVLYVATHGSYQDGKAQVSFYDRQVEMTELFKVLGEFNSGTVVIPVFMACHSGAFANYASGADLDGQSQGFKDFVEAGLAMCRANMPVLASCGVEENSADAGEYSDFGEAFICNGWKNGYADGKLQGVGYDGGGGDGYVSFWELIQYAKAFARGISDFRPAHVQCTALEHEQVLRETLAGRVPDVGPQTGVPMDPPDRSQPSAIQGVNSFVRIGWEPVSDAKRYWIYMLKDGHEDNGTEDWECVCYRPRNLPTASGNNLYWVHKSALLGAVSHYKLRSVNCAGASEFSDAVPVNEGKALDSCGATATGPGFLHFRWRTLHEGNGSGTCIPDSVAELMVKNSTGDNTHKLLLNQIGVWKNEKILIKNGNHELQWTRTGDDPVRVEFLDWKEVQNMEMDGVEWQFTKEGELATVMGGGGDGAMEIPAELDGTMVSSIGEGAFFGQTGLTSVLIPEGVKFVGDGAFAGCSGLTSVVIPESVVALGNQVFAGCINLATLSVPAEWEGTAMLAEADIPIGCNVVYRTIDRTWNYSISNGVATVTGVTPADGHVVIPSTLGGYPVTSIGTYAFYYCSDLTSVSIPSCVTNIGQQAFYCCSGLTSVSIPDSVTTIGMGAFAACSDLTNVTLGGNVSSIGESVFSWCTNLTSVTIPDSVTNIGKWVFCACDSLTSVRIGNGVSSIDELAFVGCGSLKSFSVADANPAYKSESGLLLTKDGTTLIAGVNGDVVIPDSVTNIGKRAFYDCRGLTSVRIPDHVTSIGEWAFSSCTGLTNVTIPDSVLSIGNDAFYGCGSLMNATIGGNMSSIGESVFSWCTNLTSVTIGNGVATIGGGAFYQCSGLASVTMPDGVTAIGSNAFHGCSGLTSVTIPGSVTNIGIQAFYKCSSLESFSVTDANPAYKSVSGLLLSKDGTTLIAGVNGNVVIPSDVTVIGDGAFYLYSNLTSVTIGGRATDIGSEAFYGCSSLTNVAMGNSVTNIREGAFLWCSNLMGVAIGDSVTSIGGSAFHGCSSLTNVIIPDSMTSIGDNAFGYCSGLRSVVIPDSVMTIGSGAFLDCYGLTNVVMGNSLTSIARWAFHGCTGLTSVMISDRVTNIGDSAFYGCSGLRSLTIPNSVTLIGGDAFHDCSGLRSVMIPDGVTSIGVRAFYNCSGLTNATLPDSVLSIGWYAFSSCIRLTTLYVPVSWQGTSMLDYAGIPSSCTVVYGRPPEAEATTTGVPYNWIEENAAEILAFNDGDHEKAAMALAANGLPVWQCYMAGLSTTNVEAKFKVKSISFENGEPVVKWDPDLDEDRAYTVQGKPTMADDWGVTNASSRFFRVLVELPE